MLEISAVDHRLNLTRIGSKRAEDLEAAQMREDAAPKPWWRKSFGGRKSLAASSGSSSPAGSPRSPRTPPHHAASGRTTLSPDDAVAVAATVEGGEPGGGSDSSPTGRRTGTRGRSISAMRISPKVSEHNVSAIEKDLRAATAMFSSILVTDTGKIEAIEEDYRRSEAHAAVAGAKTGQVKIAGEAIFAVELSPWARTWKFRALPFLLVTLVGTFVLLITSLSQSVQRQAVTTPSADNFFASLPFKLADKRVYDVHFSLARGDREETMHGAFPASNNILRSIVCGVVGPVLFAALYWALRARRVGQLAAALAMVVCSVAVVIMAGFDIDAIIHQDRAICKLCKANHELSIILHEPVCTCTRTRFFFIAAMDLLLFIFLLLNGFCLWRYAIRIGMTQAVPSDFVSNLTDVFYFVVNLVLPSANPQCEFCLQSCSREAMRWHRYYCEKNFAHCVFCSERVNFCRLDHHERNCPSREVKCPLCSCAVLPTEMDTHQAIRCPRQTVKCPHCDRVMLREVLLHHSQHCDRRPRCRYCDNSFTSVVQRDAHEHGECSLRPVKCIWCKLPFPVVDLPKHENSCNSVTKRVLTGRRSSIHNFSPMPNLQPRDPGRKSPLTQQQ